ncbi:MAG: hypothetical protein VXZ77_03565 [Pseudomonadota bacterium]|nr:hypothetical protein [Pseudomonadota bacterium]
MYKPFIFELGLNHLGKEDLLAVYLKEINSIPIANQSIGITIQLNPLSPYWDDYQISDPQVLRNFLDDARSIGFSVGLALGPLSHLEFENAMSLAPDFVKLLTISLENREFRERIVSLDLGIPKLLSIGNADLLDASWLPALKGDEDFYPVHTRFEEALDKQEFEAIGYLMRFARCVYFGNHCSDLRAPIEALKAGAQGLLLYVKHDDPEAVFPDDIHAVSLSTLRAYIETVRPFIEIRQ